MKTPKILNEFKEFAMRGNVIDMAVGVIIGGAFGKIVTSVVNDIIMPLISFATGSVNLAHLAVSVDLSERSEAININYGMFLQNVLDFLIISICIFAMVKFINTLKTSHKEEAQKEEETPPQPSNEEKLLMEIRDLLKKD